MFGNTYDEMNKIKWWVRERVEIVTNLSSDNSDYPFPPSKCNNIHTHFIYANLGSPAFSFSIVDGIYQASIIPVLNHIVRPIMNLYFNCIPAIVDKEYDAPLSTSNHR